MILDDGGGGGGDNGSIITSGSRLSYSSEELPERDDPVRKCKFPAPPVQGYSESVVPTLIYLAISAIGPAGFFEWFGVLIT
jgi:hypothetical protein